MIIHVAGNSGCGKSTLMGRWLDSGTNYKLIEFDDIYKSMANYTPEGFQKYLDSFVKIYPNLVIVGLSNLATCGWGTRGVKMYGNLHMFDTGADLKIFLDVPESETKRRRLRRSVINYISGINATTDLFEKLICGTVIGDQLRDVVSGDYDKPYQDCREIYKKEKYTFVKSNEKVYKMVYDIIKLT
jgi:hypothetical protein